MSYNEKLNVMSGNIGINSTPMSYLIGIQVKVTHKIFNNMKSFKISKEVIRDRKSKNRQYNDQGKGTKRQTMSHTIICDTDIR